MSTREHLGTTWRQISGCKCEGFSTLGKRKWKPETQGASFHGPRSQTVQTTRIYLFMPAGHHHECPPLSDCGHNQTNLVFLLPPCLPCNDDALSCKLGAEMNLFFLKLGLVRCFSWQHVPNMPITTAAGMRFCSLMGNFVF